MYRKMSIPIILFVLVFIVIILLIGCTKKEESLELYQKDVLKDTSSVKFVYNEYKSIQSNDRTKSKLGISKGEIFKSYSTGYEGMYNLISNESYICGVEDKGDVKNNNIILIDKEHEKKYIYSVEGKANSIYVDKKSVYYTESRYIEGNKSYITKLDISTRLKKEERLCIEDIVITYIEGNGEYIYAYGFDYNSRGVYSKMYVINKKGLDVFKVVEMSRYVIDVTDIEVLKNDIYICGRTSRRLEREQYVEVENKHLYVMNVKDYSVRKVYFGALTNKIIGGDECIYISGYDEVLDEGNMIYIYDLKNKQVKKYNTNDCVRDFMIKNRKLYVLGKYKLKSFNIKKNTMGIYAKLEEKRDLWRHSNEKVDVITVGFV